MTEKDQKQTEEDDSNERLYYKTIASATACTGMIPAQPATDDEAENYKQIHNIPQQKVDKDD